MKEKIDIAKLKKIFREITESLDCEYVGAEFEDERSGILVRIYIDSPEGVGHTQCETVSRKLADFLDASEEAGSPFFEGAYSIEVSSPGLERPLFTLEHFRRFIGRRAAIKTTEKKRFTADIVSCRDDGEVEFKLGDGSPLCLRLKDIARANLVFVMEKGEKKSNNNKINNKNKDKNKDKKKSK